MSLAEKIAALADPRPKSFDPEDLGQEEGAALVCDFPDEEGERDNFEASARSLLRARLRSAQSEDDPRYGGQTVSRRQLQEDWEDEEDDDSEVELLSEGNFLESPPLDEDEESLESEEKIAKPSSPAARAPSPIDDREGAEFSAISEQSLKEDIEKGRAAKCQLELWDALLETRIKLQKSLSLSNQFPQSSSLPLFQATRNQVLNDAIRDNNVAIRRVLHQLLDLQATLLAHNPNITCSMERRREDSAEPASEISDEEIPSDDEQPDVPSPGCQGTGSDEGDPCQSVGDGVAMTVKCRKRTRKRSTWMSSKHRRDYEEHIGRTHAQFRKFRDDTISKWNSKLRLASGKISSKSFIQSDQSVLAQVEHILQDRQRLIRRTQLKRSVYRVLGKALRREESDSETVAPDGTQPRTNAHLMDYDEEIFDDDDFYHQLLRELINRKTAQVDVSDSVTVGKHWLELQRLKAKIKKKVDTKASKGRRIRYHPHQKLVGFMAPVEVGTMSDTARNDLFSSLFGARTHRQPG